VKESGGRFGTRGRYGAAIAQGTAWRTIDTCTSTTVEVVQGRVRVNTLAPVRRQSAIVTAGHRGVITLAKALTH
jgi:ferric-dicitrate binding protein FerR (iron transport regulator)